MMDWLSHINGAGWAAILTPIFMALILASARPLVKPDADGWIRLRPPLLLHAFGVLFFPMALFFTAMPFLAFMADDLVLISVFVILGPPLAFGMWYGVYGVWVVRVRFNDHCIEYRGLSKKLIVEWREVRRIVDSVLLGTYISTDNGRLIIWKYLRGFPQFIEEASKHDVEIDPALISKNP